MSDISLSADVDTSGVASGMAAIENQVKKSANSIGSYLSSAFTAGAIIAEIDKITSAAETIHREAARFGIDAEQLQIVSNAAKSLGLDIGTVAKAMNLLEINAEKALDPTTKQALAMEHLGISAKAFAALNPEQQFLALADAYKNSAQDGQAYADVAELIGRRNTEMIPLLAQGSAAIIDQGKSFRIASNEEIENLHALKVEQDKAVANLEGFFAQSIVGWSRLFATIKHEYQNFLDWWNSQPSLSMVPIGGMKSGQVEPDWTTGVGHFGTPATPSAASLAVTPPTAGAAVGITDIAGGGGSGGGLGGTAEWLQGLDIAEKINVLLKEREEIQTKLDSQDEQGDQHAASRYALEQQLQKVDQALLPLKQQLAIEEQKGVDAADRQIEKSQGRVELDQLELQIKDAQNKGDEYGAFLLQNQHDVLAINLDFNEKIQAALDKANEARAKGLEQTAEENELLATQLDTERQSVLALQQQQEEQQQQRISQGPNPLTVNALAADNLRLGATSDVYAQAVAASRGLQPGSDAYNRLLQQITAQDQLRNLQGQNLSSADATARDKLVQWFNSQQQQKSNQAGDAAHQQEIDFFQAIAQGRTPSGSNPYNNIFGIPNLTTGQFTFPGAVAATTTPVTNQLQSQIDLQQKQLDQLTQITKNTTLVSI